MFIYIYIYNLSKVDIYTRVHVDSRPHKLKRGKGLAISKWKRDPNMAFA